MDKRLTVEIPEEIHHKAKSKSYSEGKTLKEKVIELLKEWLNKENNYPFLYGGWQYIFVPA